MTDKLKKSDWAEMLVDGGSNLPSDELTFTDGSNGGIDGYYFDGTMNKGVEDAARLPEVKGLSGLPDGIITTVDLDSKETLSASSLMDTDDGFHLDSAVLGELNDVEGGVDESKLSMLTNLDWLDVEQDPKRLPQMSTNVIPELEEQWGNNHMTDGSNLIPSSDFTPREEVKQRDGNAVSDAVKRASRRLHYGYDIREIAEELLKVAGLDTTKKVVKLLQSDVGLVGNVFIRASAFPGIKNGKWSKQLRKMSARYVITDDQVIADKVGKIKVSQVPWGEALDYFEPRMKAVGYRVASNLSNPKKILQDAFLSGIQATEQVESYKPVHTPKEATKEQVKEALIADSLKEKITPKSAYDKALEKNTHRAKVRISKWVKSGLLSREDAQKISASGAHPDLMLKSAAQIIGITENKAMYEGSGSNLPKDAQLRRAAVLSSLSEKQAIVDAREKKRFMVYLAKKVKSGDLTVKEVKKIAALDKPVGELVRITSVAIKEAASKRITQIDDVKVKNYTGHVQKQAVQHKTTKPLDPFMDKVLKAASSSGVAVGDILNIVKWSKKQMNTGAAGNLLDGLLAGRFSEPVLKAANEILSAVRGQHEGLAGFMYVDAEAYASPTGVAGCKKGALQHRSDGLKIIKAMDRCIGCVHVNANQVCNLYNKQLLTLNNKTDQMVDRQRLNIKLANADDSEKAASLFDVNEFGLQNEINVGLDPEISPEKLGSVLFGGMDLGD